MFQGRNSMKDPVTYALFSSLGSELTQTYFYLPGEKYKERFSAEAKPVPERHSAEGKAP